MSQVYKLSVVLVSFNMRREVPRTLYSLSAEFQRDIQRDEYEVILVDNGSHEPWAAEELSDLQLNLRVIEMGPEAPPSPAKAVNAGIQMAAGKIIGVFIDGARLASPGLLRAALRAARIDPRPVIVTCGFHLGREHQSVSIAKGYSREVEDDLLTRIGWQQNGYRLFDISVFNGACPNGWFSALSETNAIFLPKPMWQELGGYDEAFGLPGGGLVNLDLYKRALDLPETQLILLLGEGTFHQVHGGVSSNSSLSKWQEWAKDYQNVKGQPYVAPEAPAPLLVGTLSTHGTGHLEFSVRRLRGQSATSTVEADYIELLAKVLLNESHPELELLFFRAWDMAAGRIPVNHSELGDHSSIPLDVVQMFRQLRRRGRLPNGDLRNIPQGYTMIGRIRLDNIKYCVESILQHNIAGDLVECGVWKGGACIYMRGILKAYGVSDRTVWLADSFRGLPLPDPETDEDLDLSRERFPQLAASEAEVRRNFERFGLLDSQVKFLNGWFCDTLPQAPISRIAVLRMDGDLYSSTMDILYNLYDKVSAGGYIIVDDYGAIPQCARAVQEFRQGRGIISPLEDIDGVGVFWQKEV